MCASRFEWEVQGRVIKGQEYKNKRVQCAERKTGGHVEQAEVNMLSFSVTVTRVDGIKSDDRREETSMLPLRAGG